MSLSCFIILFGLYTKTLHAKTWYVDASKDPSPDLDGESWDTAWNALDPCIQAIESENDPVAIIYLAEGTYYGENSLSTDSCFSFDRRIYMYGGFAGTEDDISSRPYPLLTTILDGDIGVKNRLTDNCYHILNVTTNSVFDGITFQNGYAIYQDSDGSNDKSYGGVIALPNFDSSYNSLEINFVNCTFKNNYALEGGVAYLSSEDSTLTFDNCIFENNYAMAGTYLGGYGAAIYSTWEAYVNITNSKFINNEATYRGAALYADYGSIIYITNSDFYMNKASGYGGAVFIEDRNSQTDGTFIHIINCNFINNTASYYGGAVTFFNGPYVTMYNTLFEGNTASLGGAITNYDQITYLGYYNNTFINNNATYPYTHNDTSIYDYYGDYITMNNTNITSYELIDSINNTLLYSNYIYNDIYNGSLPKTTKLLKNENNYYSNIWDPSTINLTDYMLEIYNNKDVTSEYNTNRKQASTICYVDNSNSLCPGPLCNKNDGESWHTAYQEFQSCLSYFSSKSNSAREIWVAQGTYQPTLFPDWVTYDIPDYKSFVIKSTNIAIYGGFNATETKRSQRNFFKNPTILDCSFIESDNNCTMLLIAQSDCIIDGFIFKGSRVASELDPQGNRQIQRQLLSESENERERRKRKRRRLKYSTTVSEVLSSTSGGRGGGIFSNSTNIVILNSIFADMEATKGGGVYCLGNDAYGTGDKSDVSPTIINAIFINNVAERGAAFAGDVGCDITCTHCQFIYNRATEKGGSIYLDYGCDITVQDSFFLNNEAYEAGGCIADDGGSKVTLINSNMSENYGDWEAGCIYGGSHGSNTDEGYILSGNLIFNDNYSPYGHDDIWLWYKATISFENYTETVESETNANSSEIDTGTLVGIIVASILFVVIIVVIVFVLMRKKGLMNKNSKQITQNNNDDIDNNNNKTYNNNNNSNKDDRTINATELTTSTLQVQQANISQTEDSQDFNDTEGE